ncbi:MAG: M67 family metallopeptidase [Deltaproteobacteria bacterium]|nr:M67 family metallopeptidase [Deltaproteobacteria bacterium]
MLAIEARAMAAMRAHAEETFPEECCGALFVTPEGHVVRRMTNVQNALHAADPSAHPRDARTAYQMDPRELFEVNRDGDRPGWRIMLFYHSHPSHGVYFSPTDKARALWGEPDGEPEPAYPGVAYVVISVYEHTVRDVRAYAWNVDARDFEEVVVRVA